MSRLLRDSVENRRVVWSVLQRRSGYAEVSHAAFLSRPDSSQMLDASSIESLLGNSLR